MFHIALLPIPARLHIAFHVAQMAISDPYFAISPSRAAKWQFQPLYFAIFPDFGNSGHSILPFHPPAGLNSNNHPSILPLFQILAIPAPYFAISPSRLQSGLLARRVRARCMWGGPAPRGTTHAGLRAGPGRGSEGG